MPGLTNDDNVSYLSSITSKLHSLGLPLHPQVLPSLLNGYIRFARLSEYPSLDDSIGINKMLSHIMGLYLSLPWCNDPGIYKQQEEQQVIDGEILKSPLLPTTTLLLQANTYFMSAIDQITMKCLLCQKDLPAASHQNGNPCIISLAQFVNPSLSSTTLTNQSRALTNNINNPYYVDPTVYCKCCIPLYSLLQSYASAKSQQQITPQCFDQMLLDYRLYIPGCFMFEVQQCTLTSDNPVLTTHAQQSDNTTGNNYFSAQYNKFKSKNKILSFKMSDGHLSIPTLSIATSLEKLIPTKYLGFQPPHLTLPPPPGSDVNNAQQQHDVLAAINKDIHPLFSFYSNLTAGDVRSVVDDGSYDEQGGYIINSETADEERALQELIDLAKTVNKQVILTRNIFIYQRMIVLNHGTIIDVATLEGLNDFFPKTQTNNSKIKQEQQNAAPVSTGPRSLYTKKQQPTTTTAATTIIKQELSGVSSVYKEEQSQFGIQNFQSKQQQQQPNQSYAMATINDDIDDIYNDIDLDGDDVFISKKQQPLQQQQQQQQQQQYPNQIINSSIQQDTFGISSIDNNNNVISNPMSSSSSSFISLSNQMTKTSSLYDKASINKQQQHPPPRRPTMNDYDDDKDLFDDPIDIEDKLLFTNRQNKNTTTTTTTPSANNNNNNDSSNKQNSIVNKHHIDNTNQYEEEEQFFNPDDDNDDMYAMDMEAYLETTPDFGDSNDTYNSNILPSNNNNNTMINQNQNLKVQNQNDQKQYSMKEDNVVMSNVPHTHLPTSSNTSSLLKRIDVVPLSSTVKQQQQQLSSTNENITNNTITPTTTTTSSTNNDNNNTSAVLYLPQSEPIPDIKPTSAFPLLSAPFLPTRNNNNNKNNNNNTSNNYIHDTISPMSPQYAVSQVYNIHAYLIMPLVPHYEHFIENTTRLFPTPIIGQKSRYSEAISSSLLGNSSNNNNSNPMKHSRLSTIFKLYEFSDGHIPTMRDTLNELLDTTNYCNITSNIVNNNGSVDKKNIKNKMGHDDNDLLGNLHDDADDDEIAAAVALIDQQYKNENETTAAIPTTSEFFHLCPAMTLFNPQNDYLTEIAMHPGFCQHIYPSLIENSIDPMGNITITTNNKNDNDGDDDEIIIKINNNAPNNGNLLQFNSHIERLSYTWPGRNLTPIGGHHIVTGNTGYDGSPYDDLNMDILTTICKELILSSKQQKQNYYFDNGTDNNNNNNNTSSIQFYRNIMKQYIQSTVIQESLLNTKHQHHWFTIQYYYHHYYKMLKQCDYIDRYLKQNNTTHNNNINQQNQHKQQEQQFLTFFVEFVFDGRPVAKLRDLVYTCKNRLFIPNLLNNDINNNNNIPKIKQQKQQQGNNNDNTQSSSTSPFIHISDVLLKHSMNNIPLNSDNFINNHNVNSTNIVFTQHYLVFLAPCKHTPQRRVRVTGNNNNNNNNNGPTYKMESLFILFVFHPSFVANILNVSHNLTTTTTTNNKTKTKNQNNNINNDEDLQEQLQLQALQRGKSLSKYLKKRDVEGLLYFPYTMNQHDLILQTNLPSSSSSSSFSKSTLQNNQKMNQNQQQQGDNNNNNDGVVSIYYNYILNHLQWKLSNTWNNSMKQEEKKIFFWLDPTDKQQIQETKEYCATYTSEYVQTGRLPIFLPLIPYNILKDEIQIAQME